MTKTFLALISVLLVLSRFDDEVRETQPPLLLKDCTEATAEFFSETLEWKVPEVPDDVRHRAIREATNWAVERCYFPCDYVMCGSISEYSPGRVSVYVSYEFKPVPPETDSEVGFIIGPEASVTFSLPDFERIEETLFHSGCRWRAKDCALPGRPSN